MVYNTNNTVHRTKSNTLKKANDYPANKMGQQISFSETNWLTEEKTNKMNKINAISIPMKTY